MRRPLQSAPAIVLSLIAAGTACRDLATGDPVTYSVVYQINTDTAAVADSIQYDNGSGTLVWVRAPVAVAGGVWSQELTVTSGGSVWARAWFSTSGVSKVGLVAQWTTPRGTVAGDSSHAIAGGKLHFAVELKGDILP